MRPIDPHAPPSPFALQGLDTERRTLRLRWDEPHQKAFAALLPQRAVLTEGLCEPTEARITCLSTDGRLPLQGLLGEPFGLQLVTDRGELRTFPLLVTQVSLGPCDGSLTVVHLVGRDAMSLMGERRRLRCFEHMTLPQVVDHVLAQWGAQGLGRCFTHAWLGLDFERHAQSGRHGFIQHPDESDSGFVQRLLRTAGIAWFWRPCPADLRAQGLPRQELVLFEAAHGLPPAVAEALEYHRRDPTGPADTVDLLVPQWRLVPGATQLRCWDHESASLADTAACFPAWPREPVGGALARGLGPVRVCVPQAGPGRDGLLRMAASQCGHQHLRAQALLGRSGVRTLAPGTWQRLDGYPAFEALSPGERRFTTTRVEHFALNNLPAELQLPALALLGEPSWPDWAQGEPAGMPGRGGASRPPHRYVNRFEALPWDAPIAPLPLPLLEHEQPRLRPLTGLVAAPQGSYTQTDPLGRARVQLLGGEPGADTTTWVRHRTPWAGAHVGFSAVLRPGTEVDIEWLGYDRPVIAGCHFNARTPPPPGNHHPGLTYGFSQTALVGRELGGGRRQHLLLDDFPSRPMAQLASEAGHSALSLGELSSAWHEGRADARGTGFELRSDAAGAIRTAQALLLSAWARLEARGGQLDAQEHVALLQEGLELFKSLGRYAAQHQGLAPDEAAQQALLDDVQGVPGVAPASAGTPTEGRQASTPTLNLTAPAGMAASTPKTIVQYAGVNIDSVAMQHLQWTAGQRLSAQAGQGIAWFAQHGGISAIAHHGTWLMQSQHGDVQVDSGRDVKLGAQGKIVGLGQEEITFMTAGGAFLRLKGGDVEVGGPGALRFKGASHHWEGPAGMGGGLPTFGEGELGRTPRLLDPISGEPVPGMPVRVEHEGGVLQGRGNAAGEAPPVKANALRRLKAIFFDQRS